MRSLLKLIFPPWSAPDASGKIVRLYAGFHKGLGRETHRDGMTEPEIQRVRNLCARDMEWSRDFWIIFALAVALWILRGMPLLPHAIKTLLAVATVAVLIVAIIRTALRRPGRSTFILAMLDINRCPSCAYTLPRSAKSPEPVQCSECGSHWRYALD